MNRTTRSVLSYRIYAVERRHTRKPCWVDIGTAFTHRDGKGFDLELQTMPLSAAALVARTSAEKRLADGTILRVVRHRRGDARRSSSAARREDITAACL